MKKIIFAMMAASLLSACQSMNSASPAKIIESNRQSYITHNAFSNSTQAILIASGLTQAQCLADFDACLQAVDDTLIENNAFSLVSLAELHFAHANALKASHDCQMIERTPIHPDFAYEQSFDFNAKAECKKRYLSALYATLRHSYAYMFYDKLTNTTTKSPIASEQDIKAQDLYHVAKNLLIDEVYPEDKSGFAYAKFDKIEQMDRQSAQINIGTFTTTTDDDNTTLNIYLDNDNYYASNFMTDMSQSVSGQHIFSELTSIYDTNLPTMQIVSTRFPGIGVGYVGTPAERYNTSLKNLRTVADNSNQNISERIHPMPHILLTALVVPSGDTPDEVLNSRQFFAYFFNPYSTKSIQLFDDNYPIFANFSSGYAKWVSDNRFRQLGIFSMVAKNNARLPELFMLEPYNPNKKVIIMLHGLASGPMTWVQLTNNLLADPVLRNNYQVWQIFYSTNLPILENRYQIQKLIEQNFYELDPTNTHAASKNAVIIGHSMGAVISRLMLSDDDLLPRLNTLTLTHSSQAGPDVSADEDMLFKEQQTQKLLSKIYHSEFDERFRLHHLAPVDTAIFISAPFRGTDYADRWFTRAIRRIIHLPSNLTQTITNVIKNDDGELPNSYLGDLYLQNGASQLSDKSAFMALTDTIAIHPSIRYHSIMADNHATKSNNAVAVGEYISDGIVPYTSSHLEGAASETVLTGGHSIHENPQTIVYLRKILHNHLPDNNLNTSLDAPLSLEPMIDNENLNNSANHDISNKSDNGGLDNVSLDNVSSTDELENKGLVYDKRFEHS